LHIYGKHERGFAMGNQTVVLHCEPCGVSSPRDITDLDRTDLKCHVCGEKFAEEALIRSQQGSKVLFIRARRR
jgi:hypothetical protein